MTQPVTDHRNRKDYGSTLAALRDAHHVQNELVAAIDNTDGLFVDPDEIRFLARRAERLILACVTFAETDQRRSANA